MICLRYASIPVTPETRLVRIKEFSERWKDLMGVVQKAFSNHNEKLRICVKYEELRADTIKELKRLYEFLEIQITLEELEKIIKKHDFENIPSEKKGRLKAFRFASPGHWIKAFNDEEKNLMQKIMGDTLKCLRYSV